MGTRHVLSRVAHPQTNGKLERARGHMQRKLRPFLGVAGPPGMCPADPPPIGADPAARFVERYDFEPPHASLYTDVVETPAVAFENKTPPQHRAQPTNGKRPDRREAHCPGDSARHGARPSGFARRPRPSAMTEQKSDPARPETPRFTSCVEAVR